MVGAEQTRIVAVPEAREAYGRFPCDRHRDRSELELMFGDSVDFGLCDAKVRELRRALNAVGRPLFSKRFGCCSNIIAPRTVFRGFCCLSGQLWAKITRGWECSSLDWDGPRLSPDDPQSLRNFRRVDR